MKNQLLRDETSHLGSIVQVKFADRVIQRISAASVAEYLWCPVATVPAIAVRRDEIAVQPRKDAAVTQARLASAIQYILNRQCHRGLVLTLFAGSRLLLSTRLCAFVTNASRWTFPMFLGRQTPADGVLISEGRVSGGLPYRVRPGQLMKQIRRQAASMIRGDAADGIAIQIVIPPIWRRNATIHLYAIFHDGLIASSAIDCVFFHVAKAV